MQLFPLRLSCVGEESSRRGMPDPIAPGSNLLRAGIAAGGMMKIGGWRTRGAFDRYAIVS